jgi:phage N-6-adenine-methyltransferase
MSQPYMQPAKRKDWQTPAQLFEFLASLYGPFDLDPCGAVGSYASEHCADYWTEGGLEQPWWGRVFVNPPYGPELRLWVPKCRREAELGNAERVVALLPARTDAVWWHRDVAGRRWADGRDSLGSMRSFDGPAAEVLFLRGRVRFTVPGRRSVSATFPSVVVVWQTKSERGVANGGQGEGSGEFRRADLGGRRPGGAAGEA